jgi:hypothetical protein
MRLPVNLLTCFSLKSKDGNQQEKSSSPDTAKKEPQITQSQKAKPNGKVKPDKLTDFWFSHARAKFMIKK